MNNFLIVVDMQNDFIDGALGSKEAVAIVPNVVEKVKNFAGRVIFTRDTHEKNYMETREGKHLPVPHCIKDTEGWQICPQLRDFCGFVIDKPCFGSMELAQFLIEENKKQPIDSICLVGLCTDICVISNAMIIKSALPEVDIIIDSACCAGVTVASHANALEAMKMCQIEIM